MIKGLAHGLDVSWFDPPSRILIAHHQDDPEDSLIRCVSGSGAALYNHHNKTISESNWFEK